MNNLGAIGRSGFRYCRAGETAVFVLALILGGPALAQDAPQPSAIAPTVDWTGPFVGLSITGMSSDGEARRTRATGAIIETDVRNGLFPGEIDDRQSGVSAGVSLGYNYQRDRFVGGLKLDLSNLDERTDFSFSRIDPEILVGVETTSRFATEIDGLATLSYRGGYAKGDTFVYGTAGIARASVRNEYTLDLSDGGLPVLDFAEDDGRWGYSIGFGVEHRLNERMSVLGELVYYNLEDVTVEARSALFPDNALGYTFENDGVVARFGFNLAF